MRKLLNAILFVTILFVSADTEANTHRDLLDLSFSSVSDNSLQGERYTLKYDIFYQAPNNTSGGPYGPEIVRPIVHRASVEIVRFLNENNTAHSDCHPELELNLYHVNSSVLNDHARFREWGPANNIQDRASFTLWALYDPMKYSRTESSIFLTDHGAWANEILLAHEMAHYWYDRLCIALSFPYGTEAFAKRFEKYYEGMMNRGFDE
jgi:hypothetical protein